MVNANKMNTDEHSNHSARQKKSSNHTISKKTVAITFFGSLLLALLITWAFAGFNPEMLMYTFWFPYGCAIFISESKATLYFGYAIYIAIFLCAFIRREKSFFITLLVIYILILCLNISGCALLFNIDIH
jgi:hypothetical protein